MKKKINSKLKVNKSVITYLNDVQSNLIKGGNTTSFDCNSYIGTCNSCVVGCLIGQTISKYC